MGFFRNWREKIAYRKIKKIILKSGRTKVFKNLSDIKSVLLLYSGANNNKLVDAVKLLQKEGKYVVGWVYNQAEPQYTHQKDVNIHYFGKKDLKGVTPNKQVEEAFLSRKCDVIIDLTTHDVVELQYLLSISSTNFKVGLKKDFNFAYDFMIEMAPETEAMPTELLEKIIFYLKSIQSKR